MPMWTDDRSVMPEGAAQPPVAGSPEGRSPSDARREQRALAARRLRRRRLTVTVTVFALLVATAVAVPLALRSEDPATASVATTPVPEVSGSATAPTSAPQPSTSPRSAAPSAEPTVVTGEPATEAADLPVLSEGDYGSVIEVAQTALGVDPTGYFGPKTRAAVADFQSANGLPATGMVASYTWTALGQDALAEAVTASASPDGYVNAKPAAAETSTSTRSARRTSVEPPVLEETDSGEAVAVVQRALGVRPASGYFGPVTAKAVRQFQADNGIPTTGVIATYTWAALGSEIAGQAATAHEAYGTDFGPGAKKGAKPKGGGGGGSATQGSGGLFCPVASFTYGDGLGAPRPGGRVHEGLDLMGSRREPIYSIDSGTVSRAGYQDNGALVLDITGNSGMYFYGHFDEIVVGNGEWVKAGQLIGYMGDTGSPGAVHLHLEVRPQGWSGGADDPVPLIRSLCG